MYDRPQAEANKGFEWTACYRMINAHAVKVRNVFHYQIMFGERTGLSDIRALFSNSMGELPSI